MDLTPRDAVANWLRGFVGAAEGGGGLVGELTEGFAEGAEVSEAAAQGGFGDVVFAGREEFHGAEEAGAGEVVAPSEAGLGAKMAAEGALGLRGGAGGFGEGEIVEVREGVVDGGADGGTLALGQAVGEFFAGKFSAVELDGVEEAFGERVAAARAIGPAHAVADHFAEQGRGGEDGNLVEADGVVFRGREINAAGGDVMKRGAMAGAGGNPRGALRRQNPELRFSFEPGDAGEGVEQLVISVAVPIVGDVVEIVGESEGSDARAIEADLAQPGAGRMGKRGGFRGFHAWPLKHKFRPADVSMQRRELGRIGVL